MIKMKGKILYFTYYWPPAGGPGVQRNLKFVKYLKNLGWEPIVITLQKGTYPSIDKSLEKEVPNDLQVIRTKTSEPFLIYNLLQGKTKKEATIALSGVQNNKSLFKKLALWLRANLFVPDARKGWKPYAINAEEKIIKNEKIKAIITTGPPHSTHLTGLYLKKKYDIPWLMDFRDPWTNIYYNTQLNRPKSVVEKDKNFENQALMNADALTTVSNILKDEFTDRIAFANVIYNGFDEDDVAPLIKQHLKTDKFTISYVGSLKPKHDVVTLWEALEELVIENIEFKNDFVLRFTGKTDNNIINTLKSSKINTNIILDGYVTHIEAVEKMCSANMLLFIVPIAENNKLNITGKIFEYIASGTPLLPFGPLDGEAAHLLKRTQKEQMIDYNDKATIKKSILELYNDWKLNNGVCKRLFSPVISEFTRQKQAKQLSGILEKITEHD